MFFEDNLITFELIVNREMKFIILKTHDNELVSFLSFMPLLYKFLLVCEYEYPQSTRHSVTLAVDLCDLERVTLIG